MRIEMKHSLIITTGILLLGLGTVSSFEARVVELSDKFLDFRKEGMWLVKFYAPWCGHCKRLEPIFNHVAQALYESPIRVAKVDCTRFPTVASEFKVSGFPTIMFIREDIAHVYQGDRKTDDIVKYARRMAAPAVRDLKGEGACKDIQCAFKDSDIIFAFVGNQEGPLWEAFNATAYQFQALNVFYALDKNEAPDDWIINNNIPFIAVRKEGDEDFFQNPSTDSYTDNNKRGGKSKFKKPTLMELLATWIERERFPSFVEISRGNFQTLLDTKKFIVMAVVDQDQIGRITPEMTEFKNMVHTVVLRNKEKYHKMFQFGWLGTPSLANSIAMDTLPIPSLFVLNASTFQHHIPDDDPAVLTAEAIDTFLETVLNSSAPAYGGKSLGTKIYRAYYEGKTSVVDMWTGNPVLTTVIFGLPLAFLSLIFYSICCADFMDASDDDHVKRD